LIWWHKANAWKILVTVKLGNKIKSW